MASGLVGAPHRRVRLRSSRKTDHPVLPDAPQSLVLGPLRSPARASPLATNSVAHQSATTPAPVIDTSASLDDLQTSAYQRLQAASDRWNHDLRKPITTCEKDFSQITNAAYLLVREDCDLLQLVQQRTMALGRQNH